MAARDKLLLNEHETSYLHIFLITRCTKKLSCYLLLYLRKNTVIILYVCKLNVSVFLGAMKTKDQKMASECNVVLLLVNDSRRGLHRRT